MSGCLRHHAPDRPPRQLPLGVGRRPPRGALPLGVPPEDRLVEGLRRVQVGRDELVPAERTGLVGQLRPRVRFGLPEADDRTQGIGEDGHAPRVHDVHRRHEHHAAVGGHLGHRVVGAVHVDVGHPDRRHVRVHLGAEPGHRLPAQVAHGVPARFGRPFGAVPAEQAPVELPRLGKVRAPQVHPRGDSVFVALVLHGAISLSACSDAFDRTRSMSHSQRAADAMITGMSQFWQPR